MGIFAFVAFATGFFVSGAHAASVADYRVDPDVLAVIEAQAVPIDFPDVDPMSIALEPETLVYRYDPLSVDRVFPDAGPIYPPLETADIAKAGGHQQIDDTTQYPYSTVVKLYMKNGDFWGACSGSFIFNTRTVLTAGHCVWDNDNGGGLAEEIIVIPGLDENNEPFEARYAVNWATNSSWSNFSDYTRDWGVIEVAPYSGTGFLGAYHDDSNSWYTSRQFDTAGYPSDSGYPGDEMWWDTDSVEDIDSRMIQIDYKFGTWPYYCIPGQSGSSIYHNAGGGAYNTIAVLTLGSCHGVLLLDSIQDFVEEFANCSGCVIDGQCWDNGDVNPDDICQQCNVASSGSSWSPANAGASCNDGKFCNGQDTCSNGSCSNHSGDPCGSGKECSETQDQCVDEGTGGDDDDDDDDDDGDDDDGEKPCADVLTTIYTDCDLAIMSSGEALDGETAFEMCKDDSGPWDCIRECIDHPNVDDCTSFAACLSDRCNVTTNGKAGGSDDDEVDADDDDDDDDGGACGGCGC
ncbi:trypsin-like serine protease [bacterium]|nr:trypsin-like serine protease [bacterium]